MTKHVVKHITRRRIKKKPGKKIRRIAKKNHSGLLRFLFLLMIIGLTWVVMNEQNVKGRKDIDSAPIWALDKVYMGCKVFWLKQGPGKICSQAIVDTFFGAKEKKIQTVVVNGMEQQFLVKAKHQDSSKSYQINNKGIVYLDVKGCLVKVEGAVLTEEDFESLEAKCKK